MRLAAGLAAVLTVAALSFLLWWTLGPACGPGLRAMPDAVATPDATDQLCIVENYADDPERCCGDNI